MSKRILILEDEVNIVESLAFLLSREGFKVVSEPDGAAAMARINDVSPDLIILDVMLPNRSGFDILHELRQSDETRETPVLMLTAKGQARDREHAAARGADRFMSKPFGNSEIVETVRDMLGP